MSTSGNSHACHLSPAPPGNGSDVGGAPQQRLRVAFVLNDSRMGGSERQALLLAREYLQRGLQPCVLSLAGDGPVLAMAREMGMAAASITLRYPCCLWRFPLHLLRARRFFRHYRPNVMLGFTSVPNLYAGWLWKCAGARMFIWGQRNAGLDCPPRFLEWVALRCASAFVANSEAGVAYLRARLGPRSRHQVYLVPNAVAVMSQESASVGEAAGAIVRVVCVANARAVKDHATLLAAWSVVQAQWPADTPRPQLDLAGAFPEDSTYACEVRDLVNDMPCRETIRFCGAQVVNLDWLRGYDVGVLSSKTEGMSNAILEYMAAGLPVVATDLPGTRLALGEEASCWLVPVGDSQRMATVLLRLLESAKLRTACGERNRERARREFTVGALADQMMSLVCGSEA